MGEFERKTSEGSPVEVGLTETRARRRELVVKRAECRGAQQGSRLASCRGLEEQTRRGCVPVRTDTRN